MPPFKLMASTPRPDRRYGRRGAPLLCGAVHPEVTHTKQGTAMHARLSSTSGWPPQRGRCPTTSKRSRRTQGANRLGKRSFGLSGGVDSSLLLRSSPRDWRTAHLRFVDNGLLRLNEGQMVMDLFARKPRRARVIHVDATEQFMATPGTFPTPKQKRKIIGREFVEVFQAREETAQRQMAGAGHHLSRRHRIAGSKTGRRTPSSQIGPTSAGCPETLNLKLLEPLRELFKDEVRELGVAPGSAARNGFIATRSQARSGVRILGEVKLRRRSVCAVPTRSLSKNCAATGTAPRRPDGIPPSFCRSRVSA